MLKRLRQLTRDKFWRDAATLQVSGVLNQLSQLVSSAVLAFLLGAHAVGLFVVAVMLQALLYNMLNVGVLQTTVGQVAAASTRGLHEKLLGWLAFVVKTHLVFSTLLISVGWFVLPRLSVELYAADLGVAFARQVGLWAWWLTFWFLLDTPRAVAQVAFQGTRRMLALAKLDNGQELLRMVFVVGGALITGSAAGAVIGEVASRALASYMALGMYHAACGDGGPWLPSMRQILERVPHSPLARGLRQGLRVGVVKNATALAVTVLPRLLLSSSAGFAWVAYFHVAQRIMGLPGMLMQGVSRTIVPALSEQRGRRDLAGFRRLYVRTTWLAGGAITVCILVGLALVRPFVALAYPADFAGPVWRCCAILALGVIPYAFAVAQGPFYILANRMKANLLITFLGALITIPLNVLLVQVDPRTGPVWGQSLYLAWALVHSAYIAHYFKQHAHSTEWED